MTGASDKSDRAGGPTDLSRDASQPKALIPSAVVRAWLDYLDNDEPGSVAQEARLLNAMREAVAVSEAFAKRRHGPTMPEMAVAILAEWPDGLQVGSLIAQFATKFGREIARTTLSPQLSRLAKAGTVELTASRTWRLTAQAIEARRAETLGSACESAVRQDAPETPLSTPLPSGSIER